VVGFFDTYRRVYRSAEMCCAAPPNNSQDWVKHQADRWNAPLVEAPEGRRDEFVEPYFRGAEPDEVVVILKAREPARIMTAVGDRKTHRWHLQIADRWVVQYLTRAALMSCSVPTKTAAFGSVPTVDLSSRAL
jgi:hypothetical protein